MCRMTGRAESASRSRGKSSAGSSSRYTVKFSPRCPRLSIDRMLAGCSAITRVICESVPGALSVVSSRLCPVGGMGGCYQMLTLARFPEGCSVRLQADLRGQAEAGRRGHGESATGAEIWHKLLCELCGRLPCDRGGEELCDLSGQRRPCRYSIVKNAPKLGTSQPNREADAQAKAWAYVLCPREAWPRAHGLLCA